MLPGELAHSFPEEAFLGSSSLETPVTTAVQCHRANQKGTPLFISNQELGAKQVALVKLAGPLTI
jgi:hypothetical protein